LSHFSLLGADSGDILLLNADFSRHLLGASAEISDQIGLIRLATFLKHRGFKPAVLSVDARQLSDNPEDLLANFLNQNVKNFRVLGFHLTSWNISSVTRAVKKLPPETRLLFGGPLATSAPQEVVAHFQKIGAPKSFAIVAGYGEMPTLKALENSAWETIPELFTAQSAGLIVRPHSEEIASWPLLDLSFSAFAQKVYAPCLRNNSLGDMALPEVFSAFGLDVNHGCAYDCAYCSLPAFGRTLATYSPERVVQEMRHLSETAGIFMFTFTNSNLLFWTREWILNLIAEIKKNNLHEWATWTGYHHPLTIDLLSAEDLKLLKASGCEEIVVGVQSIDPKILEIFQRPKNTFEIMERILKKTQSAGLNLVIDYITGVPDENLELVRDFFEWCLENRIECREFLLKIYPGTALSKISGQWTKTHDLVPVTGELAPALESFAVVPKAKLPAWFIKAEEKLRENNQRLTAQRKIRLGQSYITDEKTARDLLQKIPKHEKIPPLVQRAMALLLQSMLTPANTATDCRTPTKEEMLRTILLADENSPPMVRKMNERMRAELGEEKFKTLKEKFTIDK
jgi:radical SAM superfamily enzyme YgiQ (UPF0313 family)